MHQCCLSSKASSSGTWHITEVSRPPTCRTHKGPQVGAAEARGDRIQYLGVSMRPPILSIVNVYGLTFSPLLMYTLTIKYKRQHLGPKLKYMSGVRPSW